MNCQLLSNTAVHATHVVSEIGPSRLTRLYLDVDQPIGKGKIRWAKRKSKYTAERNESLLDCLSATWEAISKAYFQTGYFVTPGIRKSEMQLEEIQAKVLDGRASLSDFRKAVERWEEAVISAGNYASSDGLFSYGPALAFPVDTTHFS
ncbi:MAG: hypothetical protein ACLP9S_04240 [Syntrophales bacterium]